MKGQSLDMAILDENCEVKYKKVWTVGEVSILAGLALFAGIGLWRIVEIICGVI